MLVGLCGEAERDAPGSSAAGGFLMRFLGAFSGGGPPRSASASSRRTNTVIAATSGNAHLSA